MKSTWSIAIGLASALALMPTAQAVDLGSSLKGLPGGLDVSSLASGSAGNAAGIIGYCVKNNYLGSDAVGDMKDRLMGKLGVEAEEPEADPDYQDGLMGLLKTGDGERVDMGRLGELKKSTTRKACAAVLDHAGKLL